jgi:uncharacterized protein YbjT (DUF2867 family)
MVASTGVRIAIYRGSVDVADGELGDVESLTAACADVDVGYSLVHLMGSTRDFVAEEDRAAANVVTQAAAAGSGRLIYLGGLHPPPPCCPQIFGRGDRRGRR